jgi:hypothetical protein
MAIVRKVGRQLLATRSVHLDIHPRPANLSESREVLRVLQGFGAIDIYKTLAVRNSPSPTSLKTQALTPAYLTHSTSGPSRRLIPPSRYTETQKQRRKR